MAAITVLTPNPAVDVTYRVPRQVLGQTVRVESVEQRAGGKGINVVRVLRALGHDALAVQPLGGDTGRWIHDQLTAEGIRTLAIDIQEPTRTTVAAVDGVTHPTLYAEPGPVLDDATWHAVAATLQRVCEPGGILVIAGSFPPRTHPRHVHAVVEAGHRAGVRVLADTSGVALVSVAEACADLLKPNADEATEATGTADVEAAIDELRARGAVAVVVSRGDEGLVGVGADGRLVSQPAVPNVRGNPTGAGDAALAGLAAALHAGAPLDEALRWAAVLGAAAVQRPTAGDVQPTDLLPLSRRLPAAPAASIPFPPVLSDRAELRFP